MSVSISEKSALGIMFPLNTWPLFAEKSFAAASIPGWPLLSLRYADFKVANVGFNSLFIFVVAACLYARSAAFDGSVALISFHLLILTCQLHL